MSDIPTTDTNENYSLLTLIDNALLGPMFDKHGQLTCACANLHVCTDQSRIDQCNLIVDVQIAGHLELWVPYLDDGHRFGMHARDFGHSTFVCQLYESKRGSFGYVRLARTEAIEQTIPLPVIVMQTSTWSC